MDYFLITRFFFITIFSMLTLVDLSSRKKIYIN